MAVQPAEGEQFLARALFDERVGQADVEGVLEDLVLVQQGVHRPARAARQGVLLDGDEDVVGLGEFEDEPLVQRLDKAHVGDGGPENVPRLQRRGNQAAPGEDGDAPALPPDFALADGQCA